MYRIGEWAQTAPGFKFSLCVVAFAYALSACGGGSGGSSGGSSGAPDAPETTQGVGGGNNIQNGVEPPGQSAPAPAEITLSTRQEAGRFLTQATFGPSPASVDHLLAVGYTKWLQEQFAEKASRSYKDYWNQRNAAIKAVRPAAAAHVNEINHVFWTNAVNSPAQLRHRVALALSEIFVISTQDGCVANQLQGAAGYFDMLAAKAFGDYRDLLQSVALHPVMGCYLSHLRNQKEDLITGRVPDENFAREIMQLFSIGLYQLNMDGSYKRNEVGQPIETYTGDDVAGLAKVFTGWSFQCPDWPSDSCFRWGVRLSDQATTDRWGLPMRGYPKYHSTSEKRFLGVVVPPQSTADPDASLKIALDTLATHPNVGPFIGKQLIQRLVTSNPSPAYIKRVAETFRSSGGSLQATVAAILMDSEARSITVAASPGFGKVREPLLRVTALLRAYGGQSASGGFLIWNTNDPGTGLGQNPYAAPSVFNFFRPGYSMPGSEAAKASLVSPEMQIANEASTAGYVNLMRIFVGYGFGMAGYDNTGTTPDVTLEYHRNPDSPTIAMAVNPEALVENVNQRMMYGTMPAALKSEITTAVGSIDTRSKSNPTAAQIADTLRRRVWAAILLTMASPEFQVQK